MRTLKILVADDDEDMRATVKQVLRPLHAEVHEAQDGVELVTTLAREAPFDLVVTDVRMPWMSGLAGAMAARTAGVATPFLVMSAFGDHRLRRAVAAVGGAAFLSKPFSPAELRATAEALLSTREGTPPSR